MNKRTGLHLMAILLLPILGSVLLVDHIDDVDGLTPAEIVILSLLAGILQTAGSGFLWVITLDVLL